MFISDPQPKINQAFATPTAIKIFDEKEGMEKLDDRLIRAEIDGLSRAKHPNINKLLAVSFDGPNRCLVLEYMDGGALDKRLKDTRLPVLQWRQRARILLHVARGIAYMHSLKTPIIHRDIKCGNVLLATGRANSIKDGGDGDGPLLTAQVSDFGESSRAALRVEFSQCRC